MYRYIWPKITADTKAAVMAQLDKDEISIYNRSGIFEIFETAYASSLRRKYGLVVSSGTAGLHTAFAACGFAPGDEVIFPAYTFFATASPVFQTGAIPVLCDAASDGNIDPGKIEALITPKTKAIVITHMWGIPCDMNQLMKICRKHSLRLIEDCSHAHGAYYDGQPVGSHGDFAVFSLQGQKIITGGEGGIVFTNDQTLYERALLFGHYNKRCRQEIDHQSPLYDYAVTGYGLKLRAHPLAIAMAYEQFGHLEQWHTAKHRNALYLSSKLQHLTELQLPKVRRNDEPSWYAYTFLLKPHTLSVSAQDFCNQLVAAGIADADMPGSTRPLNLLKLFQDPAALYPDYAGKIHYRPGDFPMAESFSQRAIKLPIDVREDADYRQVLDDYARIIEDQVTANRLS